VLQKYNSVNPDTVFLTATFTEAHRYCVNVLLVIYISRSIYQLFHLCCSRCVAFTASCIRTSDV